MLAYIVLFLFFQLVFSSLTMIPVSEIYNGYNIVSDYYSYCTKSPDGSINYFYKILKEQHLIVYDQNDEIVSKSIIPNSNVNKLEYFGTEKEYLKLSYDNLYYINENDNIENYIYPYKNFLILKNKDFIVINYGASLIRLTFYLDQIEYYFYPPIIFEKYKDNNKISFSLKDVDIKYYEILETSKEILFFLLLDEGISSHQLDLYTLDKKTMQLNKTKTLHKEITGFTLINIDNDSDNFIYCISKYIGFTECFLVKYKNKTIILENSVKAFSNQCEFPDNFLEFRKNYALLNDSKIAIICNPQRSVYLTILEYKNNNLTLGNLVNKKILYFEFGIDAKNIFLMYNLNKGLILYYFISNRNEGNLAFFKSYINESCSSFEILANNNTETNISFYDYISGGVYNLNPNFIITDIDPKITLFNNNKVIKAGSTSYNKSDNFSFIAPYSDDPLIIKFKNTNFDYSCRAIINIFHYLIKVQYETYKCDKSPEIETVNNITYHNLNKTFILGLSQKYDLDFNVIFSQYPGDENLIYKFSNIEFSCKRNKDFRNYNSIYCKIPVNFEIFPPNAIKYEYNIYSNFSCLNSIYLGTITIEDRYLIEIIEAENLTKISENIDKTYDASQKIENFTVDMINYYQWFASFAYCDDDYIKSGECCKKEILTDWEVISHKNYLFDLFYYLDFIKNNNDYTKFKFKIYKIEEIEADSESWRSHVFNYVILKSSKFKKYVFTFPGGNNMIELYSTILFSDLVQFDEDNDDIQVNKLFLLYLNLAKNDIFSKEILEDIKRNKDYQIIFIGHSFGGAIATLASYYFTKNKLAENEPILITFGQPRVGNENFARHFMKLIHKVFRIERYKDYISMLPLVNKFEDNQVVKLIKLFKDLKDSFGEVDKYIGIYEFLGLLGVSLATANPIPVLAFVCEKFCSDILNHLKSYIDNSIYQQHTMMTYGYCHIGGLYVLNKESNKFYHCKDFYNEEINSPFCKNWVIDFGKLNYIVDLKSNNNYLTQNQNINERCQEKKIREEMAYVFA